MSVVAASPPASAPPASSSDEEDYSSSDDSYTEPVVQSAPEPALLSDVSDEELDWDTADEPPKENEPIVRIRCVDTDVLDWDGLKDSDYVAFYGKEGFNRHINGIYRRESPQVYKKEGDGNEVYLFQTEKWWRLSSRLDSESSLGYTRNENAPTPQLALSPWKIFSEAGTFDEDLNIRVRALADSAAANEFQIATKRKRTLSSSQKSLVATLVNRGMNAKAIANCTILHEEACDAVFAATASRCEERTVDNNTEAGLANVTSIMTGKTEDELTFALRTHLTPYEKQRVCSYVNELVGDALAGDDAQDNAGLENSAVPKEAEESNGLIMYE